MADDEEKARAEKLAAARKRVSLRPLHDQRSLGRA